MESNIHWRRDPDDFYSDWKVIVGLQDKDGEENKEEKDTVTYNVHRVAFLPEGACEAFPLFLNFIYSGGFASDDAVLDSDKVIALHHLSDRLLVPSLKEATMKKMKHDMKGPDDAVGYCMKALGYGGMEEILDYALKEVATLPYERFKTDKTVQQLKDMLPPEKQVTLLEMALEFAHYTNRRFRFS
eukprot:CAMPEP_0178742800 /NCGR_PEP_ID=MMETSP0744-20121128/5869_1 /TAXON_ID=913974 /ORGANISM="Nitzschia punctata, Strain CCMP561" /LENGTH=185 /DNA_ID=CAMNT_0020395769 /DNA_START=150 /DNA_END=708 /DNA_ORIENTATION=+